MAKPSTFGIGVEPEYPPEDYPINIRFLAQGMMKVPKKDVPEGLKDMTAEEVMKWVRDYWSTLSREELLKAVGYLDIEEDSHPGAVEVNDGDDYEIIAQTQEWVYFNEPGEVLQAIAKTA